MRSVRLGNTSLRVTDLALGTGALASRVDEKTSLAIMDCYIGEGGNFIDTANVYGRWNPGNLPLSEMMIGKWLSFHHLRDKVVLATKGAADNEGEKGKKRLSREEIRHDLHDSLKNLKTDYIRCNTNLVRICARRERVSFIRTDFGTQLCGRSTSHAKMDRSII